MDHSAAAAELAPMLEQLQRGHDVVPFMDQMISSAQAAFHPMPEGMVDIIAANPDFRLPARGSGPVWLDLVNEDGSIMRLIVVRPASDGELWVLAPARARL